MVDKYGIKIIVVCFEEIWPSYASGQTNGESVIVVFFYNFFHWSFGAQIIYVISLLLIER